MAFDAFGRMIPLEFDDSDGSRVIIREGSDRELSLATSTVSREIIDGQEVLVVNAGISEIGHTALYAAFLHHTTGNTVYCRSHQIELPVYGHQELVAQDMSDQEIQARFAKISGVGILTEKEQRDIARTALILQAGFMKIVRKDSNPQDDFLRFDELEL